MVWPGGVVPTPPSARIQFGVLLLREPSTLIASATVWPPLTRISWAPCGCLPPLVSATCVSPPLADAGTVNFAVLPCSAMDRARFVGLAPPPPQAPMVAAAAVSARTEPTVRGRGLVGATGFLL